jgi:hypothetical protein
MFIFLAVPINGGNFAEFYTIILFWEVLKLGVALPGRVDIWGVTGSASVSHHYLLLIYFSSRVIS